MQEYMDAPPPVYTAGPKNGTNGANVGGRGIAHRKRIMVLFGLTLVEYIHADWV